MYERKVGKAYLRGCLRSLAVAVVGGLLGVGLLLTVLFLIDGGRVEPRSPRFTLALLVPFFLLAAVLIVAWLFVRVRAARLDRAFEPWRLHGRQAGPVMRSWHGEVGGRAFDAWFYRGPTLELYLGCRPATRAVIHRGGALLRALGRAVEARAPMAPSPLDGEGASVYADDEAWMRRLLARGEARQAVVRLIEETARVATVVSVAPDAVRYVRRFQPLAEIEAGNLRRWLAELAVLAAAVDAVGPSAAGVEPTQLETWARTSRDRYLNRILLAVGLVGLLVMAALFVFSWLFVGQG